MIALGMLAISWWWEIWYDEVAVTCAKPVSGHIENLARLGEHHHTKEVVFRWARGFEYLKLFATFYGIG
jgi:hypothetical protein